MFASSTFIKKPIAALSLSAIIACSPMLLVGCGNKDNGTGSQAKAQEYIDRAESYRRQGQFRAAIIEARNALQQNPQDRAAMAKFATILNELGQGKGALKVLEPITGDASREEALLIAQAYISQHKYQSALEYLNTNSERLKLKDDAAATLLVARAQTGLGQFDKAQANLDRLDANNLEANIERGRLLLLRQPDAAKSHFDNLLQQNPDNVELLSESARIAERQGDLNRAEDLLSKALLDLPNTDILLPQKAEILQRLVTTLTKLGRSNEALVYAKTLSDANPSGALLQDKFKQGLELFQAGKLDEAETLLSEVYNESHNDTAGMLIGMIRYAKKDLNGAAQYLGGNIDPEVAPEAALTTLAATQLQLAQPEKLLALFDASERANIKSPELKMLVGIALLQTGGADEGSKLVQNAQAEQPDNPAIQSTLARYYLMTRQLDKAIAVLEPATKSHPDDNLNRLLITAYASSGKPDQALATARKLADSIPAKAENFWVLGRTALQLRKPEIAEPALRKAIAQQPDFAPAQLDMAQLHLVRKEYREAETIYRALLKQKPDMVGALRGLSAALTLGGAKPGAVEAEVASAGAGGNGKAAVAEFYLRLRQLDDAGRLLAAIPENEASNPYPREVGLQLILLQSAQALQAGDYDKARSLVASGLETRPDSLELLILLARLDLQAKNIASAKKIAEQLTQIKPTPVQSFELAGDIAMLEGDTAAATANYRKVWSALANDALATKLYQSYAKNPAAAGAFLAEWLKRLPDSPSAHFLLGISKQQAGDNKGAIKEYETALARNPEDPRALNNLAWLYFENKDGRALATAEKAYKFQPENAAVLDTYGWILVNLGNKQQGLEVLKKAQTLAPESAEIKQHVEQASKKP